MTIEDNNDTKIEISENEFLKTELNTILYTLQVINSKLDRCKILHKEFLENTEHLYTTHVDIDKDTHRILYKSEILDLFALSDEINNCSSLINNIYKVLNKNDITEQFKNFSIIKENIISLLQQNIKEHKDASIVRNYENFCELEELRKKQEKKEELDQLLIQRQQQFLSNLIEGKDFIDNIKENNPEFVSYCDNLEDTKIYEQYSKYYKHAKAIKKDTNFDDFRNYQLALQPELITKKELSKKDFTKYDIIGLKPDYEKYHISKRQLPTEIFKYLIAAGILKEDDLKQFSTNQFGRTFEAKMGDILTEDELPEEQHRKKRYNLLDFTKSFKISSNIYFPFYKKDYFSKKIYVSTEWDKNSIEKFIDYITQNYSEFIKITYSNKNNLPIT